MFVASEDWLVGAMSGRMRLTYRDELAPDRLNSERLKGGK